MPGIDGTISNTNLDTFAIPPHMARTDKCPTRARSGSVRRAVILEAFHTGSISAAGKSRASAKTASGLPPDAITTAAAEACPDRRPFENRPPGPSAKNETAPVARACPPHAPTAVSSSRTN
jgi:hypothetical protein